MASFFKSFFWAGKGILTAIKNERNMRFHLCAASFVIALSHFYGFSAPEKVLLAILICGVLALEMINSAIEAIVDLVQPHYNKAAGRIKDIAAGAVLVFSVGAAAGGVLLFWDIETIRTVFVWFGERWWAVALFMIWLAASVWFVFGFGKSRKVNNGN